MGSPGPHLVSTHTAPGTGRGGGASRGTQRTAGRALAPLGGTAHEVPPASHCPNAANRTARKNRLFGAKGSTDT